MNRLLFLAPDFYGIAKIVQSSLERSGYHVVYIENRELPLEYSNARSGFRYLRKLYFLIFSPRKKYLEGEFDKLDDLRFDCLFAINCHSVCSYLFEKLRPFNPKLKSILYLWDSLSRYKWQKEASLFDHVFTFDRKDAEQYRFRYQPNFWIGIGGVRTTVENDLFFAGKFSPARFHALDKIVAEADKNNLSYDLILHPVYRNVLHSRILYLALRHFVRMSTWINDYVLNYEAVESGISRSYIKSEPAGFHDIQHRMVSSNVIIDLPERGQSGYTHRVIEALANGKKVLTTNVDIKNESFFQDDQIRILDPGNPEMHDDWFKERKQFRPDDSFEKLEINQWLKTVVDACFAG